MIPLPFGDATQWAKNLFAAGGGTLRFAGREHRIAEPRIIDRDEAASHMPRILHGIAGLFGLRQFVLVRRISSWTEGDARSVRPAELHDRTRRRAPATLALDTTLATLQGPRCPSEPAWPVSCS